MLETTNSGSVSVYLLQIHRFSVFVTRNSCMWPNSLSWKVY